MSEIELSHAPKVLILGVGGVSMCQLAKTYKEYGYIVYGYDCKKNKNVEGLQSEGVLCCNTFNQSFLDVNFCVRTGAIDENNIYVKKLRKLGVPIIDRAVALGELLKNFKTVIAVAGTHGKSTTSALIYEILRCAGKKVSCHIGAEVDFERFEFGDEFVVVEACEYNKSFLQIYPHLAVVTNVEPEHLDSYGGFTNLKNAFATFFKRAKKRFIFEDSSTEFLKRYKNVKSVGISNFSTPLKGEYNQKNIALAVAVCKDLGIDESIILQAVANFKGLHRRFEYIGNVKETKIYIDYAHHPTELNAFVQTFTQQMQNSLIIFQPHTYSRTKMFFDDFVKLLAGVENVMIYKEYPAREKKSAGIDAKTLSLAVKKINPKCEYLSNDKGLKNLIANFSAVAFVGAGDINELAYKLCKKG